MNYVEARQTVPILLGRQGEFGVTTVVFDLSLLIRDYGPGVAQVAVRRPTESTEYAAVITQEGNSAYWAIGAEWTQLAGTGTAQLDWYVQDALVKSVLYRTAVQSALGTTTPVPPPEKGYLDQITAAGAAALANAQAAAESAREAEDAQGVAEDAAHDAEAARVVAVSAQEAAEDARGDAVAAKDAAAAKALAAEGYAVGEQNGETVGPGSTYYENNAKYYAGAAADAQTAAEDAKDIAVAAKDDAVGAKNDAVTAKDDAVAAQTAAEGARDEAEATVTSAFAIKTVSGPTVAFTDGADDVPVRRLTVDILPVQSGSGTPAPDHIRPISGVSAITLDHCDNNNPKSTWIQGYFLTNNGEPTQQTLYEYYTSPFIPVNGKLYVDIQNDASGGGLYRLCLYDNNRQFVSLLDLPNTGMSTHTATTYDVEGAYVRISRRIGNGVVNYATGELVSYTFAFGQTIFGGVLDILTGVLSVTRVGMTFTGQEDWKSYGSGASTLFRLVVPGWIASSSQPSVPRGCSHFKNASISTTNTITGYSAYTSSEDDYVRLQFRPVLGDIPDLAAWISFLQAQYAAGTPVTCWLELISGYPTIPLTPARATTLLGDNTFYTDYAGATISLTYCCDPSLCLPDAAFDPASEHPVENRVLAPAISGLQLGEALTRVNLQSVDDILYSADYISGLEEDELEDGGINPNTGANYGSAPAVCRAKYFRVPQDGRDMVFTLGLAAYECTSWSYSGKTVATATHTNTFKTWISCDQRIFARFTPGDKYCRVAFRRADGGEMTAGDYAAIREAFSARMYAESPDPLNLINQDSIKGRSDVAVQHNDDGSITAATVTDGTYRYFRCLGSVGEVLKPNHVYILHCRILSMSGATGVCYMRFRGEDDGANQLSIGIGAMNGPGEYAVFYRATGYESNLDFFITGGTSAGAEVTVTDLMLAEADISLPYVPYGVSKDTVAPALGAAADGKMLGRENALAHSAQYAQVRFCPVADLPSQFSAIGYKFPAGVVHQGVPYSSARGVDKLIGPQITLHTFLTAVRNPRSVLYTRTLTYGNARTYYGCVCSALISHSYHQRVNWTTESLSSWDRLERIKITDIKPGDILLNGWHVRFITGVYRDVYGRILGVSWSEAGTPDVRATLALPWDRFLRNLEADDPDDVYYPYRYKDLSDVEYVADPEAPGYPDEPFYADAMDYSCKVVPDIMSEYGDRAVLLEGEDTVINVLDATGYDTITVSIDGTVTQTITTLADFTLSDLAPGLYEITMTGPDDKSASTQFYVCQATCAMAGSVLSFSSTNSDPVAVYTFTAGATNKLVILTPEDIEAGEIDLADYLDETYQYAKIAFAPKAYPEWGVATWYTNSPESLGFWVAYTP